MTRRDWRAAVVNGFRDLSVRVGLAGRVRAVSFGSQLDGLVCVDRNGQPAGPAIIWMDRRGDAAVPRRRGRVPPDEWYARSGCNLDGAHVAPRSPGSQPSGPIRSRAPLATCSPGPTWCGSPATPTPSIARTRRRRWLLDPRTRRRGTTEPARGVRHRPGAAPAGGARRTARSAPIAPWLREATGLAARDDCRVRLRRRDGRRRSAPGVVDPGAVCDVIGTAEPVCAVTAEPLLDPTRPRRAAPARRPRRRGCSRTPAARPAAPTAGSATTSAARRRAPREERVDVYELLNELAAEAPAGSDGARLAPGAGGAMAPEWNADARAVWYGLTPAHTRAHLARALLEGSRPCASRHPRGDRRGRASTAREIVCVAGGARSPLCRQIRADVDRPAGHAAGRRRDDGPRRGDAGRGGGGAPPVDRRGGAAMARESSQVHEPDPAGAAACAEGHRRYRVIFDALADRFGELA